MATVSAINDSVSEKYVIGVGVRPVRSTSRLREVVENEEALMKPDHKLTNIKQGNRVRNSFLF